jgi:hypothetical protein
MEDRIESDLTKIREMALKADYEGALKIARTLRKLIPGEFKVEYTYAKILGDYADELPLAKRKKLKNEAIKILEKCVRKMNGQNPDVRFGVRINYYYQTQRFRDLEKVGMALYSSHKVKGLYAAGLGSSLEAERLITENKKGNPLKAKKAATRSVSYWKEYFRLQPKEDYYFPYSLRAMSEAILGNEKEMEKALAKSTLVSGRKKTYWEFEEVRKLFQKCK